MQASVRASSALLLPGPQPPLTHFGVTLLRHVVVTGLRYTLYHLGLPLPDRTPTRIVDLRLELDGRALEGLLGEEQGSVISALVDPGGVAAREAREPVGAAFFHRCRLLWTRRRDLPSFEALHQEPPAALERRLRDLLSRCLPILNDALLGEVLEVLRRRSARARGSRPRPSVGLAAAAWLAGRPARLERLGLPDAYLPSWASEAPELRVPEAARAAGRHPARGRFREIYRQSLDAWRPTLLAIGESALARGVVDHRDDLFFLPFELLGDLGREERPAWLAPSVLRNRGEYFRLRDSADAATAALWASSPLQPLD